MIRAGVDDGDDLHGGIGAGWLSDVRVRGGADGDAGDR